MDLIDTSHFHGLGGESQILGLSLQEMIDTDIKADFDDFSCSTSSDHFGGMENLDLFKELDFKLDDEMMDTNMWCSSAGSIYDSALSSSSAFSSSYLEDMTGATSIMVNPNSVMPVHHQNVQQVVHDARKPISTNSQIQKSTHIIHNSPIVVSQSQQLTLSNSRGFKTLKIIPPVSSPMQQVPSPLPSQASTTPSTANHSARKKPQPSQNQGKENGFPKPAYSYSCLIALALKNSHTGSMSVSEIYKFMCEHFPYFKTAPSGWKNSVRHNLSLNKCFEKIEKPSSNGNQRKGCLWAMNPAKISKMEEEVAKWSRKDPMGIKKGMLVPENLESLERGELVKDYSTNNTGNDSEDDEDPRTPTSVSSQGSQGYDSAGSDFVDVEGFTTIPDSSLPELNLQASGGIFEEIDSGSPGFFQANYSIASVSSEQKPFNTLVLHKHDGQRIFSI